MILKLLEVSLIFGIHNLSLKPFYQRLNWSFNKVYKLEVDCFIVECSDEINSEIFKSKWN